MGCWLPVSHSSVGRLLATKARGVISNECCLFPFLYCCVVSVPSIPPAHCHERNAQYYTHSALWMKLLVVHIATYGGDETINTVS